MDKGPLNGLLLLLILALYTQYTRSTGHAAPVNESVSILEDAISQKQQAVSYYD